MGGGADELGEPGPDDDVLAHPADHVVERSVDRLELECDHLVQRELAAEPPLRSLVDAVVAELPSTRCRLSTSVTVPSQSRTTCTRSALGDDVVQDPDALDLELDPATRGDLDDTEPRAGDQVSGPEHRALGGERQCRGPVEPHEGARVG